jgi:hypothetical protein
VCCWGCWRNLLVAGSRQEGETQQERQGQNNTAGTCERESVQRKVLLLHERKRSEGGLVKSAYSMKGADRKDKSD